MGKRAAPRKRRRSGTRRSGGGNRSVAPILLAALGLVALCLGGSAALAHWRGTDAAGAANATAPAPRAPAARPPASRTPAAEPAPTGSAPAGTGTTGPDAGASPDGPGTSAPSGAPAAVPSSGAGTFTTARTTGEKTGSGPLRRYRVQVEDGSGVFAHRAAEEIQAILAHPRGWAAHGRGSFQLVSGDADFSIRIATPKTADALCLAQGLDTGGELNCETTDGVVVNLRRWLLGSPTFAGTPAEYRHLIINHEVGHEIGIRRHMGCPGPGRLAPVMMQQIKGLDGCRSNAWPYDTEGRYITGPPVG